MPVKLRNTIYINLERIMNNINHSIKFGILFLLLMVGSLGAEQKWEKLIKKDRETALNDF